MLVTTPQSSTNKKARQIYILIQFIHFLIKFTSSLFFNVLGKSQISVLVFRVTAFLSILSVWFIIRRDKNLELCKLIGRSVYINDQ